MIYLLIKNAFDGVEIVLNVSNICVDAVAGQCLPFIDFTNLMGLHFHYFYFVFQNLIVFSIWFDVVILVFITNFSKNLF